MTATQAIPLEQIRPNPYQMWKLEDPEKLRELAISIVRHGLLPAAWLEEARAYQKNVAVETGEKDHND